MSGVSQARKDRYSIRLRDTNKIRPVVVLSHQRYSDTNYQSNRSKNTIVKYEKNNSKATATTRAIGLDKQNLFLQINRSQHNHWSDDKDNRDQSNTHTNTNLQTSEMKKIERNYSNLHPIFPMPRDLLRPFHTPRPSW